MAVARDGCVVDTPPLAGLVRGFVTDWNRSRPPVGGQFQARGVRRVDRRDEAALTAVEFLVHATGYRPKQIERVLRPGVRTTPLGLADALVTAIGHPEAFHDGTLSIRPNPQAPRAERLKCCGGSLTGTGSLV